MQPVITRPPNRLAAIARGYGGMTMEKAVQAAGANLETIRGSVTSEVGAAIDRMLAVGRSSCSGHDDPAAEELYALANTVVGMAGVFGMEALCASALSLCELLDRLKTAARWNGPAVQVHLDSLRLLRPGTTASAEEQKAVAAALRRVVQRT